MSRFDGARAAVASASLKLADAGLLIGTAGNVSMRLDVHVAVTATGAVLGRLTPAQVTVVDLDGNVVAGDLEPTSELDLHLGIYAEHATVAVVHTHAPSATALSCVVDELPCIHYQQLLLGGTIRVAPYATFGTRELARSVIDSLEGRLAALMSNHGSVTHGSTLDDAVENALLLEWLCTVYLNACKVGRPRVLDEQEQADVVNVAIERKYGTTQPIPAREA